MERKKLLNARRARRVIDGNGRPFDRRFDDPNLGFKVSLRTTPWPQARKCSNTSRCLVLIPSITVLAVFVMLPKCPICLQEFLPRADGQPIEALAAPCGEPCKCFFLFASPSYTGIRPRVLHRVCDCNDNHRIGPTFRTP